MLRGASKIFVLDGNLDRLKQAESIGAKSVNYKQMQDRVQEIIRFTGECVDRNVDTVGYQVRGSKGGEQPSSVLEMCIYFPIPYILALKILSLSGHPPSLL